LVYRYQNALLDDERLRRRLESLHPERRRSIPIAIACLCAVPFVLATLEDSVRMYLWIGVGCIAPLFVAVRFAEEYRIVRNWAAAVGTVIWFQKLQGRRSGAAIKYLFRASDGALHLGNATSGIRLARESKTLGIIYSRENPSRSMLVSQFWFYDFSAVSAREGDEASNIAQQPEAERRKPEAAL
jgi:hypothetical protein